MNKLTLNTMRSLRTAPGRFIAILLISAISCAFFVGVKSSPDMLKKSAWDYYNSCSLADIRVVSGLGIDDETITAIGGNDIDVMSPGYAADLFTDGLRGRVTVHVMSYDKDMPLNTPYLTEGRLPEASGELLLDAMESEDLKLNIGDTVTFTAEDEISDILARDTFTIVGKAQSPIYDRGERGHTNVGTGEIELFAYIPSADFSYETYTELYLKVRGTENTSPFGDDYKAVVNAVTDRLKANDESILDVRRNKLRDDADEELADARQEVADGEEELAKGIKEYEDGVSELEKNKKDLEEQSAALASADEELSNANATLTEAKENIQKLQGTCPSIDSVIAAYAETFEPTLTPTLLAIFSEIQDIYDVNNVDSNIKEQLAIYVITDGTLDPEAKLAARAAIEGVNEQVRSASASSLRQIEGQIEALKAQEIQADNGRDPIGKAQKKIDEAQAELDSAKAELDEAQAKLDDAKKELADAEAELEEKLSDGKLYVTAREDWDPNAMSYGLDCDRVDSIANVFPIFFVLLSALVCWATMTRMVESQRCETGVLKSLGYSDRDIISCYVGYGATASLIGSVAGTVAGAIFLPRAIFICYSTMYNFPKLDQSFDYGLWIICIGAAVVCNVSAVILTAVKELRGMPAVLIRPKAPRSGKRILLERMTFIWSKLPFLAKVSFRNLLRYKSRFFVSLIGVCGCTALLLTGFGLKYAISGVLDVQYGDICLYSGLITLDDDLSSEERNELDAVLGSIPEVTGHIYALQKDVSVTNGKKKDAKLLTGNSLGDFIRFADISGNNIYSVDELADDEVIVTEKLAILMKLKKGDTVTIEGAAYPFRIAGTVKNHIDHYVFVSTSAYTAAFEEYIPNTVLFGTSEMPSKERRREITEQMISCESVLSAIFMTDGLSNFYSLLDSLDMIVAIIIFFVGALTFVILLNLADINISERIRELASIKVLGFYDGELAGYVLRENTISAAAGIILGLAVGIFFENFVIVTAEVDSVMFLRDLGAWCFVAAAAVMVAFAVIVDILIFFRLKGIDMASSLKANE